jgi:hypothetical protein
MGVCLAPKRKTRICANTIRKYGAVENVWAYVGEL